MKLGSAASLRREHGVDGEKEVGHMNKEEKDLATAELAGKKEGAWAIGLGGGGKGCCTGL